MRKLRLALALVTLSLVSTSAFAQSFVGGNLAVVRVGNGTENLTGFGNDVFIDQYTTAGAFVNTLALPVATPTSTNTFTLRGNGSSEGFVNLSTDGRFLTMLGYEEKSESADINSSTPATNNRVLARIAADRTVDLTTQLTNATGDTRGAVSTDGSLLYASTSSSGIRSATAGAQGASTSIAASPTNFRNVEIYGGQLFASSQSGAGATGFRIGTVGTGLPTTTGQVFTNLPGISGTNIASPYGFFLADLDATADFRGGLDTLYVADDSVSGGLLKYSFVGGTFVARGSVAFSGARGLTGRVSGSTVELFSVNGTALGRFTDTTGYNAAISGSVTTLASAGTNTVFRGIDFTPSITEGNVPEPGTFALVMGGLIPLGVVGIRRRRRHDKAIS